MSAQTPMMQQYMREKERYSGCLLFFRMGDFFELFFEDAITASKILDIALTKRGKADEQDIPMCGVPAHSYEPYLQKLIKAGYKVAICDQLESPEEAKKRGYKEIVRREVIRVVTAGTLTEDNLLDSIKPNYLVALSKYGEVFGIAWLDISTQEFCCTQINASQIFAELSRINPSEILLPDNLLYQENLFETYQEYKSKISPQPNNIFELKRADNKLRSFYKIISLEAFGALSEPEIIASGALLEYLELTQKTSLPKLEFPKKFNSSNFVQIDPATRLSLEITQSNHLGSPSLLQVINRTKTSVGARLLYNWISSPLLYAQGINNRLDSVEFFIGSNILQKISALLNELPDIERATSRICLGRGSPRDMIAIRNSLVIATEIKNILSDQNLPILLQDITQSIKLLPSLLNSLTEAFKDDAPLQTKDGNFIKEGYSQELDEFLNIKDYSKSLINNLKEEYVLTTGISNLKILYNNMLGYFVEVTSINAKKLSDKFIHRQTMANAMRFTTPELSELQSKILNAAAQALEVELDIFNQFTAQIIQQADMLSQTARAIACVDVLNSFAILAKQNNYSKPVIDDSYNFEITNGRHPVVEANCKFMANNCNLSEKNLWLLTGPNMAGKSTFLRQNAIIAIMAQMGCYVPAEKAVIGTIDKIFSRVGASDNLAKGQSTFMIEMLETAAILNLATQKSLVILDEIGRGTATYDGLSIAWAVLEYLHNKNKCRTIFATHYHELCKLDLKNMALYSMQVKEWKGDIIFLHEVKQGAADKSYGIHVAKLAGLPMGVINRAESLLKNLEKGVNAKDMPLFSTITTEDTIRTSALDDVDPNNLSPKEALELLFKLKAQQT